MKNQKKIFIEKQPAVPLHLLSTTNEQKVGSVAPQRLPFKLAAGGGGSRSFSTSSLTQKIPFKLSSISSSVPSSGPAQGSPPQQSRNKPARWGSTVGQPTASSTAQPQRLHTSQSQPLLGHNRMPSGGAETHSILPMKLASGNKSTKSPAPSQPVQLPPSGQQRVEPNRTKPPHKPARDEPGVMYF